jgi:hypothetical protein
MSELTFELIEKKVRDLAAERPDFVYDKGGSEGCRYGANETQPGCIFGQALAALGSPVPSYWEGKSINGLMIVMHVFPLTKQKNWASRVQYWQDKGVSWGKSVQNADELN